MTCKTIKGGKYKDITFIQAIKDDRVLMYGKFKKKKQKQIKTGEELLEEFWNE